MNPGGSAYTYRTLDVWRAVGALMVIAFHSTAKVIPPERGWWARALLAGWTGVFVFFPVSGYCIFAAVSRRENATLAQFLARRWRRIVPPYWASIAFTLVVAFAAAAFTQPPSSVNIGAGRWLAVVTLTQGLAGAPGAVNAAYWSLCFEEQFYLLVALTLLAPARHRWHWLMALTLLAGLYHLAQWPASWRWDGVFLEYWLEFACGIAAFAWLRVPGRRAWAAAVFAIALASALAGRNGPLAISFGVSVAFVLLAPFDTAIAATRLGRVLMTLGVMSYSLYLVHAPLCLRLAKLAQRWDAPFMAGFALAVAVSLLAGVAFHLVVERRFLNRTAPFPPIIASPHRQAA